MDKKDNNIFFVPTRIFSIIGTFLIALCYLVRNDKDYVNFHRLLYILTWYCLIMFVFYLMNEIIYYIKKKFNFKHTKTFEIKKKIKKVKKKKPSYKKVNVEIEQYSFIPSVFLILTSVILAILTFEPNIKNDKTGLFYFAVLPFFVTSVISILIVLANNLRLEWLKTTYISLSFVSIIAGYFCLIAI